MKKILKIIILIMIIILIFQINSLYALYKNQLSSTYDYTVGDWDIRVNDTLIKNDDSTVIVLEPGTEYCVEESSEYVADGKLAPGKKVNAYLKIDASRCDVSVIYDIKIKAEENQIKNLKISNIENYYEKDGEIVNDVSTGNTLFNNNVKTIDYSALTDRNIDYKAMIPIEKIKTEGYVNIVKIELEWVLDDSESNSIEESLFAQNILNDVVANKTENTKFSIPIEITFKQYTGEEIDE